MPPHTPTVGTVNNPLDVVIVGAGFSGIYYLNNLRKLGFSVQVIEAGSYVGGTWFWNRYPGARVDSDVPIYQFNDPQTWDFPWTERFPRHAELRQYFRYLDNVLELSKDICYNTRVTGAKFENSKQQWEVKTHDGRSTYARNVILGSGSTTSKYVPPFKGLEKFQGECYHTYVWPGSEVSFDGKRVGIIGTGASAVQVIQEIGRKVRHLTIYQRTPNNALPMRNVIRDDPARSSPGWNFPTKSEYPALFEKCQKAIYGMEFSPPERNACDDSEPERRSFFESLYAYGGFSFWLGNYNDMFTNPNANRHAYNFWAKNTRARISDPIKRDLLAPLEPIHPFGTKRPCLETDYYEVCSQANVDIINIQESPIIEFTKNGIRSKKEGALEFDIVVIATGFDSLTGSITDIDIRNGHGDSIKEKWLEQGTSTYLGLATAGFPNLWYSYGPQGPTPLGNGPTIIEMVAEFIVKALVWMRKNNKTVMVAKDGAEFEWKAEVRNAWDKSLMPLAKSWYQGSNIPGKVKEPLCYNGGNPKFRKLLDEVVQNSFSTFKVE